MPTYTNGNIPRSVLKQFRTTGKYGHPTFVDHLDAAFTAVKRELGISLYIAAGQDIFRDIAGQRYWKTYWTNQGKPGNAAAVGYSNHGLAISADISGLPTKGSTAWFKVVAIFRRYGIEFNVPYESWHVTDLSIPTNGVTSINIAVPAQAGNATVRNEQAWLNKARGEKLATDGLNGPKFKAAVKRYQTFLRKYGYTGAIDGGWGAGTQKAHAKFYAEFNKPKPKPAPPKSITEVVKDQQRRLNVWKAATPPLKIDGIPGPKFKQATGVFQKAHGLTPDQVIGPKTWALLLKNP